MSLFIYHSINQSSINHHHLTATKDFLVDEDMPSLPLPHCTAMVPLLISQSIINLSIYPHHHLTATKDFLVDEDMPELIDNVPPGQGLGSLGTTLPLGQQVKNRDHTPSHITHPLTIHTDNTHPVISHTLSYHILITHPLITYPLITHTL